MKLHHRQTCRLCDSASVQLVVKLEPIPLSENYTEDSESGKKAERYPVDLYMCAACGHVQQLDVVDSKSLWDSYTYYSGEAKGMPEHFEQVAGRIRASEQPPAGSLVGTSAATTGRSCGRSCAPGIACSASIRQERSRASRLNRASRPYPS